MRDFILHNEQSRTVSDYALSMLLLQADLYAERGWGNDMTVGVRLQGRPSPLRSRRRISGRRAAGAWPYPSRSSTAI